MPSCGRHKGFALLIVLMMVAVTVIISVSYLSGAAISSAGAKGFTDRCRAQYLAESGIQHAMYLIQVHPDAVNGSDVHPLGAYTADEGEGSYTISVSATEEPGEYLIRSDASAGRSTQTCQALVRQTFGLSGYQVEHGMLIAGEGTAQVPESVRIIGPTHVNGNLVNHGWLHGGPTTASGWVNNLGRIDPGATEGADPVVVPMIAPVDYMNYNAAGLSGDATTIRTSSLNKLDPIAGHGAISESNPAGVVYVKPRGKNKGVTIGDNFMFIGTLMVEGDIILDGHSIKLTSVDGFPALVCTGTIIIKQDARAKLTGLVYSSGGVAPQGNTTQSKTTINGALVCQGNGFSQQLLGQHHVNYKPRKAILADDSGSTTEPLELLNWIDGPTP